jgi:hypothetical protein
MLSALHSSSPFGLTPRAPDRATVNELNQESIGHLTEGNGEATPSAGPVALLVRRLYFFLMEEQVLQSAYGCAEKNA